MDIPADYFMGQGSGIGQVAADLVHPVQRFGQERERVNLGITGLLLHDGKVDASLMDPGRGTGFKPHKLYAFCHK